MSEYGVSQFGTSNWNGTHLDSPSLNITSFLDPKSRRPLIFEHKVYDYEYFTTNTTICQPVIEDNQQKYQWGFSALQLEITLCLLMLWTFGIYIMWATAHLHLANIGIVYKAPGNFKSTLSLADSIRKEFKEQHDDKDANSLTEEELMSFIKTRLKGGRVMVESPPLVPGQSAWKWIWKWVMANKTWAFLYAAASFSMLAAATTSLIWLTMTFSMVAGWSQKIRYLVFLLSLISFGLLPAGYIVVRLLWERFHGFFGAYVDETSQAS